MRAQEFAAEGDNKKQSVRRIQKMLNDKFNANLDIDGILGPLTQKTINQFMPSARPGTADEPNKTTAVQGKKVKTNKVAEAFDQPYKGKWEKSEYGDVDLNTKLPDGTNLSIMFNNQQDDEGNEVVQVEFYRNNSQEVTGEGDAQRIFATVLNAIQKYIKKYKPSKLSFSASKEPEADMAQPGSNVNPESRAKLYNRLVQRYAGSMGYSAQQEEGNGKITYVLRRATYDMTEGESNDTAISLSKLGKFHPGADTLAEFVPERASARYALHPDKWESTFYSLTNKDSDKLKYYGPKKISIPPGTLVGDMAIANKFYRAKTPEEQEQYAELYKASLQPYPVDVSEYRMPELLIPKQGVAEGLDDNGISFQVQKGKNKFATTLSVGGYPVGVYQYDANTGRSIAEIYPEFKGKGLGKLLVLHAIYTAANLGLDFQEDESRTSEYDNVLDSLSSNGYIVDDDGYWYVTSQGEQYLQQSLKQDVAEGAVEDLEKDLDNPKSYSAIDHMMQTIARDHGITGRQLHDAFVAKHGVIPDKWTREQLRELNFLGSECTKDCSGHRAGYEWSKRKGLRQANSLYSPSFNKGAALAVAGK